VRTADISTKETKCTSRPIYGVIYLNSSNDLYAAKDNDQNATNFSTHAQVRKKLKIMYNFIS